MSFLEPFRQWGELKGASTLAFLGKVIHQEVLTEAALFPHRQVSNSAVLPWTVSTFTVEKLLVDRVGNRPTTVDEIQMGPIPHDMWVSTFFLIPVLGERYLIFLAPDISLERYHPVRAFGGMFHVGQNRKVNPLVPEYMHGEVAIHDAPLDMLLETVAAAASPDIVPPI
jgi:hypothetical protein